MKDYDDSGEKYDKAFQNWIENNNKKLYEEFMMDGFTFEDWLDLHEKHLMQRFEDEQRELAEHDDGDARFEQKEDR